MRHKSAIKRTRSNKRKATRNKQWKTRMRTAVKKVRSSSDKETASAELKKTVKLLDQLSAKGVIPRNLASNNKSRLAKFVNKLPA